MPLPPAMDPLSPTPYPARRPDRAFRTTRWTQVCLASDPSEEGRRALAELCEAYYEPVVAFLRCVLRDGDAARETAHAFFERLLEGGAIGSVDPLRGRFRSYLLGAVKHFVSHQRERESRQKRGGGWARVSANTTGGLEALESIPAETRSPDAEFDRQWAVTVMVRATGVLRAEYAAADESAFFEALLPLLGGQADRGAMTALAEELEMGYDALRMAVHRMRKRPRRCVQEEIAGTLADPAQVQEEMEALFAALGR